MTAVAPSLDHYFKIKGAQIEEHLNRLIPENKGLYGALYEGARYSLLSGGKRLRPILTLATVETLQGSPEAALSPACALECIHTYSLIHDDLPCMDNDDFRRGKPTLHKVYPEGHAVLAGDFLLTVAFEIIANAPLLTDQQKVQLTRVIAEASGGEGMIAGQVLDLACTGKNLNLQTLELIHSKKTAALIQASILCGGIVANATASQMDVLRKFGYQIGLAFQIIDDVLDVTDGEEKHGKKGGSDAANHKTTYVSLLGIEGARHQAHNLLTSALEAIRSLPYDSSLLQQLAKRIGNK